MTTVLTIRPGSAEAWWIALRPKTLAAAVVPVAVGTGLALGRESVDWTSGLLALLGALLLQILSNFANDLFDHKSGADNDERVGPVRAAAAGLLTHRQLATGMVVVGGAAVVVGVLLALAHGYVIVAIGVAALISAVAYTAGPYPLGYHGLGDLFVMLFFGFVAVIGTFFVETGAVAWRAAIAALPVGSLATAILVVNNIRDRGTDERAGKRTLVVRLGRRGGELEYALLLAAAFLVPLLLSFQGDTATVLLPLVTLPLALKLWREVKSFEGVALNMTLEGTAKLMALHGLLFAVGLALSGGGLGDFTRAYAVAPLSSLLGR